MGKRAFLFPGQGSQYVGMAKDLHDNSDLAKELINKADEVIGVDLSKIMFDGPMDDLKLTSNTQPAIFLHSVVLHALVKDKLSADMVAGHSLGEYSALVASGGLVFEDAVKLVRQRGEAMLQAGIEQVGTMAAILGLTPEVIENCCADASSAGIVQCANFNSPGQVVISGSVDGVNKAMELCKEAGAKLVKELVVSGAFHSPLMKSAEDKLKESLDSTNFNNSEIPVYTNVTAKPVTDAAESNELLLKQLTAPVRWEEIIVNMIDDGADEFVEIGPGKVLQGLVKRINKDMKFYGIDKFEDIEKVL